MLKVYAFSTSNSLKIPIAMEELGLEYELVAININTGEQHTPEYLAINPNGKVPVLVDSDGPDGKPFTLTESAAILMYLAEKTGKLMPKNGEGRWRTVEQLFFHGTAVGPAFGQMRFFSAVAPEKIPFAIERFEKEARWTLSVLDEVLAKNTFVAGEEFTIADIAHFGWQWRHSFVGIEYDERSKNVKRWYEMIAARPTVQRAIAKVTALIPKG
jgi:GST-like protein